MNKELSEIEATEITERDNLAVVARVERLEAIPNKDRIELVYLKDVGYTFICEKGHKVGDLVVYVKYDSVVPRNELFEFMKETKYRVKAKSFTERDENDEVVKKIYSQGIVLPIRKVAEQLVTDNPTIQEDLKYYHGLDAICEVVSMLKEFDDITQLLKVTKYIPPVAGASSSFGVMNRKGDFPTHLVSKTDELNLAAKVKALEELKGKRVYITLKIEGSSGTSLWDTEYDELMVCSRNNQIGEHESNKFWQAVNKYNFKEKFKRLAYIYQFELFGQGIQKNKLGIEGVDLAVFNIITDKREPVGYEAMVEILKDEGFPMVPLVMVIEDFNMTYDELQELADKQRYDNGELAEGIVVRPCEPFYSKVLKGYWSAKIISREYKL